MDSFFSQSPDFRSVQQLLPCNIVIAAVEADVRDVGRGRTAAVDRERVVARIAEDLVTLAVELGHRHREDVVASTAMQDVRAVAAEAHIVDVHAFDGESGSASWWERVCR